MNERAGLPLRPADGVTVYLDQSLDPPTIVLELGPAVCYFHDPADVEAVAEALAQLAAKQRRRLEDFPKLGPITTEVRELDPEAWK